MLAREPDPAATTADTGPAQPVAGEEPLVVASVQDPTATAAASERVVTTKPRRPGRPPVVGAPHPPPGGIPPGGDPPNPSNDVVLACQPELSWLDGIYDTKCWTYMMAQRGRCACCCGSGRLLGAVVGHSCSSRTRAKAEAGGSTHPCRLAGWQDRQTQPSCQSAFKGKSTCRVTLLNRPGSSCLARCANCDNCIPVVTST